jgi:hypothetical protein
MIFSSYFSICLMVVRFSIFSKTRVIYFFLTWFSLTMIYSVLLRASTELHFDMQQYVNLIHSLEILLNPVYQREFVFFGVLTFLYKIFNDEVAVFLILDCTMYLLLYQAVSINRLAFFPKVLSINTKFTYFSMLLFFTFAMALQPLIRVQY